MRNKIALFSGAAVITLWALVTVPLRTVKASQVVFPPFYCMTCNDGTVIGDCTSCSTTHVQSECDGHGGFKDGSQLCLGSLAPSRTQRRRLGRAYSLAHNTTSHGTPPPAGNESWQRQTSALALSLLALLAGLFGAAKLIQSFVSKPRTPGARSRKGLLPTGRRFAYPGLVAFLAAILVVASSPAPPTARAGTSSSNLRPARLLGKRAAVTPALAGTFTSAVEIGGQGVTQIGGTAFDQAGNLYVTGGYTGNIVFNTSPQTTLTATQDYDFYIAKLDPDGHPLWARGASGASGLPQGLSIEGGLAVAADSSGNTYVGGGFVKTLVFKDAAGNAVATLNGSSDMLNFEPFIAKYDPSGNLLWAPGRNERKHRGFRRLEQRS